MAKKSNETREQAEARFNKVQKAAQNAQEAHTEYEARARATDEKTSRLKSLRLAKEASDAETAAKAEAEKPPAKPSKKRAASRSAS